MDNELIGKLKRWDAQRQGLPGEHWLVLLAGVGFWIATRRHPSLALRLLASVGGGMLVARAASGRQVPPSLLRWMPYASRDSTHP